jgi:hypothetical protein
MPLKIDVSVSLNGVEVPLEATDSPEVLSVDSSGVPDFGLSDSRRADSCIYCQSQEQLSDEHVIPYALGGRTIIWCGSCEACRLKTQAFENEALNGEMQGARYVEQLPSRTRHRRAARTIDIEVVRNGESRVETFATTDVPTLLTLPIFGLPRYFDTAHQLQLAGTVGACFGKQPADFLKEILADTVHFPERKSNPVQFARMVAKIAYGAAWLCGQLDVVKDRSLVPQLLLDNPNELGRLVGTLPRPFVAHPGVYHRFAFPRSPQGLLYCEVQLFASAGAPTYAVVLGELI